MNQFPDSAPLYSIWTVQDSLLQAYRTMFITAASLLLGLAAGAKSWAACLILVLLSWLLQLTWWRVTNVRARNVQFAQHMITRHEEKKFIAEPFTTFKRFQNTGPNDQFKFDVLTLNGQVETASFTAQTIWSSELGYRPWNWPTRLHMEIVLPSTYALCGLAILLTQIGGWIGRLLSPWF